MKEEVVIKVEGKEWKDLVDASFETVIKDVKIDGFRKGKAPRNVYVKKYGKQELIYSAADKAIQDKYKEVVLEGKIVPILEPKIEVVRMDEESFEAKMVLITEPTVKLGNYKGLNVKKEEATVSDEEVQNHINSLLQEYAELAVKDGVAFDGGKGENYSLTIGSHSFIPGFEEGIVGMSKGEEKDLELTFPEDYMSEELKGQKVVFKVKVNEVKSRIVPELDEEFFADLGMDNIKTKEDLEKSIKEEILAEKNHELGHKFEDDLLDKASENMEVSFADELVEDEKEAMYQDLVKRMSMQGITEELYLKYTNSTKEDIMAKMTEEATKRLKYRYLLMALIKEEKLEITDKELDEKVEELAKQYNMTGEEVKKELGNVEYLRNDMLFQKAIDLLKENN